MIDSSKQKAPVVEINPVEMLRRRWPQIFFGLFVGLALSAIYYAVTPPIYESEIEILVGQRSSEVTNNGTISGANASGDAIQEDQLATHLRLFVSRRLLSETIKSKDLAKLDSFKKASENGCNPIDHIIKHIEVQSGGEGSARNAMVLRACYRDPDPEHAAIVLNAIYESYRDYVESHGQNSTKQAVDLIEQARKTHEQELDTADLEYRAFVKSVPVLIDGANVQDIHKDRLAKLETELSKVTTSLAESRSRLEVIESHLSSRIGNEDSIDHLALLSQTEVNRLKLFLDMARGGSQSEAFQAEQPIRQEVARTQYNRLLTLLQKERTMSDAFGSEHPHVEAVRKEIEITQQFIASNAPAEARSKARSLEPAEMLTTYTSLLAHDIAEFEKRKALLMVDASREMRLAKQVESDFMRGNALRKKLERAQSRYDEVIRRLQELNLSRSYAGFSTDVLASPEVAKGAAWPKLPIVAALGAFMGLALGLLMGVAAELMDSTFTDINDLERAVGAPTIAHVPRFDARKLRNQVQSDALVQPAVVTFHAPRSTESEVYRIARTSLMVSNRKDEVRTITMTSPQPGDGKSTTISNLAVSFARTGKNVLLIDADMRRPVIAGIFGVNTEPGLSDVLSGTVAGRDAIVASAVPGLDLMPHGTPTSIPAELLESDQLPLMLGQLESQYDLVLIDAPPLLAVADPAIIARHVDSVVLTVRVRKNGRRPVEQACKILQDIGVAPAAVVVNGVDQGGKGYGYGSQSRDRYGYVGEYHQQYCAKDVGTANVPSPHRTVKRDRVAG